MEFSIDVHTTLNGEIVIEDFSREYGQYLSEDVDVIASFEDYKYSESASLNTIIKVGLKESTLVDVLLDTHDGDVDSVTFNVDKDGYYTVDHLILPNMLWWKNASDDYKNFYTTIYLTDGEKVYKVIDGEPVECTVKEIIERNIEGTTIKKCRVDVFFTANLQNCYVNYCKEIFNGLLLACNKGQYDDAIYKRDFIWMTLNIIDYLVGFKQFMEAERILESFHTCGGFCENKQKPVGCGCS